MRWVFRWSLRGIVVVVSGVMSGECKAVPGWMECDAEERRDAFMSAPGESERKEMSRAEQRREKGEEREGTNIGVHLGMGKERR